MPLLVPVQDLHELDNFLRSCFGFLGSLNPEQNGVSIATIKSSKKLLGSRIAIECKLKVTWYSCFVGRVICGVPAPVAFRSLHFLEPLRFHLSRFDQGKRFALIDLGPDAFVRAPSEFLEPEVLAVGLFLSIYPSEAKRYLNGFIVRNRPYIGALFSQLQPPPGRRAVVFG